MERVTIVGCGNAGLIHAAKLIEKGMRFVYLKHLRQQIIHILILLLKKGDFK